MNPNDPRLVAARNKARAGTLTIDELREAITLMREGRAAAHVISAKSRAAKAPVDTDSLLGELFQ